MAELSSLVRLVFLFSFSYMVTNVFMYMSRSAREQLCGMMESILSFRLCEFWRLHHEQHYQHHPLSYLTAPPVFFNIE